MSFINWAWPFSKRESKMATGSSKPASPKTELDEKDLAQLHDVLFPARIQYKSFGLQIGVGVNEIACIEKINRYPGDCLLAILDARLRKSKPLTWNDIDAALRKECVGLGNTANDIRKRYPHLFTPTATEHEREKQVNFEKKRDEKDAHHHHHEHTVKSRETSSSSSDTDSSSLESEMMKNLTKSEKKKLKKVFKYSFGQLCSASFNPVETAVQLQKKGLISPGMMMDIIRSAESQQEKIFRLVCGLDNRIRSRPERLFGCIEVLLENDALQKVGRKMLRETGKPYTHQAQGMFVMCISSSLQV